VVKGPAAGATDAPQPWGLLCNPVMQIITFLFLIFPSNGLAVEWNWQGKTEVLGDKTCPSATLSTTNPTWTDSGSKPGLRGDRPVTISLSRGTASLGTYITVIHSCTLQMAVDNSTASLRWRWGAVYLIRKVFSKAITLHHMASQSVLLVLLYISMCKLWKFVSKIGNYNTNSSIPSTVVYYRYSLLQLVTTILSYASKR
jgi:hypothetical protein